MKKLILTLLMFSSGYSEPQDLSGKVFIFPLETNTAHVRLKTSKETFTSITVCFRFFTDLSRNHALFSMATHSSDNAFLVFKSAADGRILHYVQNKEARFDGLGFYANIWQPFCSTWASESGLVQLWLNGKPSSRKFTESAPLKGIPIVVLGQEQDSHGSGFTADQSFVGMISNVHMWDYVLSHCEIQQFSSGMSFTPGNVINWRALEYQVSGKVLVEDKHNSCSN